MHKIEYYAVMKIYSISMKQYGGWSQNYYTASKQPGQNEHIKHDSIFLKYTHVYMYT